MRIGDFQLLNCIGLTKKKEVKPESNFTYCLDVITRVALAVIAVMTDATLFVPSFVVGVGVGLYNHHYYAEHHHHHRIGCGQGFMEWMAEMHFPAELSLFANLGVTICHIDHHPIVFVPYCAVALGMWCGKLLDAPLTNSCRWVQAKIAA